MKNAGTKILMILDLVFTICLTSCEENATMDVAGPDIHFQFTYSDINQNLSPRSSNTDKYQLVAQSDTIKGKDIETFLSTSGQDYTSVVEAATITNALLTLSENADFSGVDSVQIRYQTEGSTEDIVMAQATVKESNTRTISFSDVKINKSETFDLIRNNIVAKLYAVYNPSAINCFQPGVSYDFTAKTILTVKISALTEGVIKSSN